MNSSQYHPASFIAVTLKKSGGVAYYDPSLATFKNFGTYDDGEWTKLELEWRASDGKARYQVDDDGWTSWSAFYGGDEFDSFDTINLIKDNRIYYGTGEVYFDEFE